MNAVRIDNLTKTYDGRRVLDGLSLALGAGEIAAVSGKSGAGKTTFLQCVLGFVTPEDGAIALGDEDVSGLTVRRRRIGYVPQDYGLFPHLDVAGNVGFGLVVRGKPKDEVVAAVGRLLDLVELPRTFATRDVGGLSGGERQRVALARALAVEPRLFLLDEPLSAIDPETKSHVAAELRALIKKTGVPTVIVTHDPEEARMLADTRYRLEAGRLERLA